MTRCWPALLALGAILTIPGAPPPLAAGPTREQALTALADAGDVDNRRRGVLALGETGLMTDLPQLAGALRDADRLVRAFAENAMWQVWSRSGDENVDRLFAVGVEQMSARRGELAVETFTEIVQRHPEFAEGWNKRATVYYLLGEYQKSLTDCDEVMKRNASHFGALSGYGQIYFRLEQYAKAIEYWRRALKVNPNLDGVEQNIEGAEQLLKEKRGRSI